MRGARHHLATMIALGLAATLLVACAGGGGTATPTPEIPAEPDALMLQVRDKGGYGLAQWEFARIPRLSVYADGRVIRQGAQDAIYPPPLLPAVSVTRIDEATLIGLLAQAATAGLASGTNTAYPATSVLDMADTVFVVRGPSGPTETRFGGFGQDLPEGKSAAELQARRDAEEFLADLVAALDEAGASSPGEPYVPSALRLLVGDYVQYPEIDAPALDWPLATPPSTGGMGESGRCLVVTGAEAEALWDALGAASLLTPFTSEGKRYSLAVRPFFPGEEPICP